MQGGQAVFLLLISMANSYEHFVSLKIRQHPMIKVMA